MKSQINVAIEIIQRSFAHSKTKQKCNQKKCPYSITGEYQKIFNGYNLQNRRPMRICDTLETRLTHANLGGVKAISLNEHLQDKDVLLDSMLEKVVAMIELSVVP